MPAGGAGGGRLLRGREAVEGPRGCEGPRRSGPVRSGRRLTAPAGLVCWLRLGLTARSQRSAGAGVGSGRGAVSRCPEHGAAPRAVTRARYPRGCGLGWPLPVPQRTRVENRSAVLVCLGMVSSGESGALMS